MQQSTSTVHYPEPPHPRSSSFALEPRSFTLFHTHPHPSTPVHTLQDDVMPRYAELVYNGFWFSPEREALQALIDKTQEYCTGEGAGGGRRLRGWERWQGMTVGGKEGWV